MTIIAGGSYRRRPFEIRTAALLGVRTCPCFLRGEAMTTRSVVTNLLLRCCPRQQNDLALDAYFEQLIADYAQLDLPQLPPTVTTAVHQATERWQTDKLKWSEAFAVERAVFALLPDKAVSARAWHIRD